MGVAAFWMLPELAQSLGWIPAVAWIGAGSAALWLINRYIHPVCPACVPGHDHHHCEPRLHGFALPLLAAAALHSALDGWTVMAGQQEVALGTVVVFGIAAH